MKPSALGAAITPSTPLVQSVQNALKLLETLCALQEASLSELSQHTGFTMNQTFRLLATLEHEGYVSKSLNKRYRLGAKLHLLGNQADWPHALIDAATPAMNSLSAMSGETILLAVPSGLERLIVAQKPSTHSLQVNYPVGSRIPLYVGGMGVAMLAFLPEAERQLRTAVLKSFTRYTLNHESLAHELEHVRQQGYRISKDDYAIGEFSVAAPILGQSGLAVAAIAIAGFTARLNDDAALRYSQAVRAASAQIAEQLGESAVLGIR